MRDYCPTCRHPLRQDDDFAEWNELRVYWTGEVWFRGKVLPRKGLGFVKGKFLYYLVHARGEHVRKSALMQFIGFDSAPKTFDAHLSNLRRWLEGAGIRLQIETFEMTVRLVPSPVVEWRGLQVDIDSQGASWQGMRLEQPWPHLIPMLYQLVAASGNPVTEKKLLASTGWKNRQAVSESLSKLRKWLRKNELPFEIPKHLTSRTNKELRVPLIFVPKARE